MQLSWGMDVHKEECDCECHTEKNTSYEENINNKIFQMRERISSLERNSFELERKYARLEMIISALLKKI